MHVWRVQGVSFGAAAVNRCRFCTGKIWGGKVAKVVRTKEFGWRCQACGKRLTAKPVAGKVIAHLTSIGGLCPGSAKSAASSHSGRKPRKPKARQRGVWDVKKASKSSHRSQAQKSGAANRERPEVLPSKKATGGSSVPPKSRIQGEAHWSFFQDNPRQDIETDAGWRRVRLGTSQGTGRRR